MNTTISTISTVLLDRDGVINFDSPDYILSVEEWQDIPGSLEAIARMKQAGLSIGLISNQSALGRSMMDQTTFDAIHATMMQAIHDHQGELDAIAYCPHTPEEHCECRKPLPGLIHQAMQELNADAKHTIMIGDSLRDVQAALAAGVHPVLVQSGYGDAATILAKAQALYPQIQAYPDLKHAVDALLTGRP